MKTRITQAVFFKFRNVKIDSGKADVSNFSTCDLFPSTMRHLWRNTTRSRFLAGSSSIPRRKLSRQLVNLARYATGIVAFVPRSEPASLIKPAYQDFSSRKSSVEIERRDLARIDKRIGEKVAIVSARMCRSCGN